ncbi:hypothetical protein [Streptomyces sp. SYSU K21746]
MNLDTPPRVAARLEQLYRSNGKLAGESREVHCPFCGQGHWHGSALGHRNSHCADYVPKRRQKVDPRDTQHTPGYVLCEPDDASVNWDAEALRAKLFVLRNQRHRLLIEYAAMQPLGAREKRVRDLLKSQADGIAEILAAAGVSG